MKNEQEDSVQESQKADDIKTNKAQANIALRDTRFRSYNSGALVEVKGRVHDLARALAIAMPAVVKVGEEGSTGSAQAIAIGELDNTFADISSKELLEICFDKIFN
ncbi:MAG: hypothetical protein ACK4PR_12300, partial [Gammaproteobacteria bacterium]